jgi:hypothetical protein
MFSIFREGEPQGQVRGHKIFFGYSGGHTWIIVGRYQGLLIHLEISCHAYQALTRRRFSGNLFIIMFLLLLFIEGASIHLQISCHAYQALTRRGFSGNKAQNIRVA